jgi:3-oxoacyl-[acyl-carrier protein] reductase
MKTALITGASKGIGAKIAETLSYEGYNVIINYNQSQEDAILLANKINGIAIKADVSKIDEVEKMILETINKFSKIDVLVNNAGISLSGLFTDISSDAIANLFNVNVMGTFNCTKAVLPHMINRKTGKIINISSMWGEVGASCEVHYSASKAAIIGFTKALAKEVGPSGIQVNCISPGLIVTDMNKNLSSQDLNSIKEETPLQCLGSTEDIANATSFFCSEKSNFITGQVLGVNGGLII